MITPFLGLVSHGGVVRASTVQLEICREVIGHCTINMAVCQNLVPLVNIKIAGKWMFIPLKWY